MQEAKSIQAIKKMLEKTLRYQSKFESNLHQIYIN